MMRIGPCLACRGVACTRPRELCPDCEAVWSPEWRCWLPFPPSTNNLFTQGVVKGRIRRFPARRYKDWRAEAVVRIRAAWRGRPFYPVAVVIKMALSPPDNRARDASNYVKPVEDALVEARVLADDSQHYVKAVIPWWQPPGEQSGVIVTIRPARLVLDEAAGAGETAATAGE